MDSCCHEVLRPTSSTSWGNNYYYYYHNHEHNHDHNHDRDDPVSPPSPVKFDSLDDETGSRCPIFPQLAKPVRVAYFPHSLNSPFFLSRFAF